MGIYYVNSAMLDDVGKRWAFIISLLKKLLCLINDQNFPFL